MICTFKLRFSSAHFYRQRMWSDEENQTAFGKCYTEFGHGHDYLAEVSLECQTEKVDELHHMLRSVTETLDHQHLNFVIPEFKAVVPTTENLALYLSTHFQETLENKKAEAQLVKLRLFESPQIWVELTNRE